MTSNARPGLHTTTVLLSLALHLVGFGAAVGLPRLIPRRPPGNPVYVVDLVSLPPGGPAKKTRSAGKSAAVTKPAARKKAPAPKPKPKKPIKVPDRTVKKKKPPIRKPAVQKPKPPEPEPARKPEPAAVDPGIASPETAAAENPEAQPETQKAAVPGASVGIGVDPGGGGAAGKGSSDEYTFYLSLLDRNIRRTWDQPIYTGTGSLSASVSLTLSSTGRVLKLDLITPSGYSQLDRSVIRAVRDAAPFPPFPHFLGLDTLTVRIVFDLNPKGDAASSTGD